MTYSKKFETNSVTFKTGGHLLAKMALLPNLISTKLTYFTIFIVYNYTLWWMSFLKPGDTVCQLYGMDTSKGCLHLKAILGCFDVGNI